MRKVISLLLLCCLVNVANTFAHRVSGIVSDRGEALEYASVYVKGTTYGVVTNFKGYYVLELKSGTYTLVFQNVGYRVEEVVINVFDNVELNVKMTVVEELLETVVVDKNREDPAYQVIREAIKKRQKLNANVNSYRFQMYLKASLESENLNKPDSVVEDLITREKLNLIESISDVYYLKPDYYKEVKKGFRDFAKTNNQTVSVGFSVGDKNGVQNIEITNPNLYFTGIKDGVFDFNQNLLKLDALSDMPYTSPIADDALKLYRFKLIESFYTEDQLVYKIQVTPKNSSKSTFSGIIYINDKSFTLNAVDLNLSPGSLRYFERFSIIQNYQELQKDVVLANRQEFYYQSKKMLSVIHYGHTIVQCDSFEINVEIDKKFMRNGKVIYNQGSTDQNEEYWTSHRPITLKSVEAQFIHTQDSIIQHHSSAPYLATQDSIINNLKFWDFILHGIRHRNSKNGTMWSIDPLIAQIRLNTVDGYRHTFGGGYTKDWKNDEQLELTGNISYGIVNKNIRGEFGVRYMYDPFTFERFRVKYTHVYTMINTTESIRATFSPSNYADNIGYGIGHEKEWFNGFLLKAYLDYNQFRPYQGEILDEIWDYFPKFSKPQYFDPFEELVLDVTAQISFAQEYEMRPTKKVIIGSKYPIVEIQYSKGIKPWFKSDVNYDYVQLRANQYIRVGKVGISNLSILSGRYLNDREVRISNLKYFRGSDRYFFSNPLNTFQQIGDLSLRTSKAYAQANYMHHFNQTIFGKMPFFNRLGFSLAGGAAALYLEENKLKHLEANLGLERTFRIWGQIFRFGSYYVASTNSDNGLSHGVKFGLDFYNAYSHRWLY